MKYDFWIAVNIGLIVLHVACGYLMWPRTDGFLSVMLVFWVFVASYNHGKMIVRFHRARLSGDPISSVKGV